MVVTHSTLCNFDDRKWWQIMTKTNDEKKQRWQEWWKHLCSQIGACWADLQHDQSWFICSWWINDKSIDYDDNDGENHYNEKFSQQWLLWENVGVLAFQLLQSLHGCHRLFLKLFSDSFSDFKQNNIFVTWIILSILRNCASSWWHNIWIYIIIITQSYQVPSTGCFF